MIGREEIILRREGISPFLFHFCKGSNAFETLQNIICDGKIRDIKNSGYICFTEAPLSQLVNLFNYFMERYPGNPMYAPYGIGISKRRFFDLGGRPVIYGKKEERDLLDKTIQWRFEPLNLSIRDFSWLREWRIPLNKISFSPKGIMIITNTEDENNLICHELVDNTPEWYEKKDDTFFDIRRCYMGVSMEKVTSMVSKQDLIAYLIQQQDELDWE